MEYLYDMWLYYQIGYGNDIAGKLACPIAKNLFVKLM